MDFLLYGILFWIFAIMFTVLRVTGKTGTPPTIIIKMVPAALAFIFVFMYQELTFFSIALIIALIFCMFGDVGMEINILPGLGLFLFGQILFTSNFFLQSTMIGLVIVPSIVAIVCFIGLLFYIYFYRRYLLSAEEPTPLIHAVDVYALLLVLTITGSLLLWLTSEVALGVLPFIGAIAFLVSDSVIGIKEFHHNLKNSDILILSTYFLAIFLLSLSVIIYPF